MSNNNKWELKSQSYQIADTGDYDGHWELTNGKISLFTKDDPEDETLAGIVNVFNESDIEFYVSDESEYENRLLKEEIKQLKCDHKIIEDLYECSPLYRFYHCTICEQGFTQEEYAAITPIKDNVNDWVSVSDNTPEDTWLLFYNGHWIGVGKYKKREDEESYEPEYSDETSEYITPIPTHWMHLPEPPKI